MDALPGALRDRGHEVSVALPFYREIRENRAFKKKDTGITVDIQVGDTTHFRCDIWKVAVRVACSCFSFGAMNSLIAPEFTASAASPYEDNAARFIFFCKAIVELARRLTPQVEILHMHDWAPALVPVFVHAHGLPFSTVLTIHHVADQGSFWGIDFHLTNLPERFFTLQGVEFFGRLNFLKGGILYADRITTTSEHYRREILTPVGGCGLDAVSAAKMRIALLRFCTVWITRAGIRRRIVCFPCDTMRARLLGKQVCRRCFARKNGICPRAETGRRLFQRMVTRVVEEKGFEILVPLLDRLALGRCPIDHPRRRRTRV